MRAKDWDWENLPSYQCPAFAICCCCGAIWLCDAPCDTGLPQTTCPAAGDEHSGCEWVHEVPEEYMGRTIESITNSYTYDIEVHSDSIWLFDKGINWHTPVGEMEVRV